MSELHVEYRKGGPIEQWDVYSDPTWVARIELQRGQYNPRWNDVLASLSQVMHAAAQHAGDLDATLAALTLLRDGA